MDINDFQAKLGQSPCPVVVDLWAPWCGPCRQVKPVLEKLAKEYDGRVDFWPVNADENQDLLHKLGVFGIPTLVAYQDGKEVARYTGTKPARTYQALFEALANGGAPSPAGLTSADRFIRFGGGLLVIGIGVSFQIHWLMFVLGAALMFSAIYDRCPIWRALTGWVKQTIQRN
jgi:thioredoxin 1